MEELWEKIAQPGEGGQKYILYQNDFDLLYLYANGFVDFKKYKLDEWVKSFADSRQADGSYKIAKPQWLQKEKYRYNGPIGEPFDPEKLPEKEYAEAEFKQILKEKICGSTWIPESQIPEMLDYFRKQKKLSDGKIRLDKAIKKEFAEVLQKVPSPLRILQLDVAMHRKKGGAASPTTTASGFIAGIDTQKLAAERLAQLVSKGGPPKVSEAAKETAGISLKDLKRKKKPDRV